MPKPRMFRKTIDGMPIKAVKALLRSPKTPSHIKIAWQKKLKALE